MTDAELRALLLDCLRLWGVAGRVAATDAGMVVNAGDTACILARADPTRRPVRWLLTTPARASRPLPSIVAALAALRDAIGRNSDVQSAAAPHTGQHGNTLADAAVS